MRELVLMVHVSLDGFVAGSKGELDGFPGGQENLAFVTRICKKGNTILFGRTTYELLNDYWTGARDKPGATPEEVAYSRWYIKAGKIVVSSATKTKDPNTIVWRENLIDRVKAMKQETGKAIIIFGSPSVSLQLMRENLIDTYWIFINPVLFGSGIPLFLNDTLKTTFRRGQVKKFANGEVAIEYNKIKG
ncbi:MAG: dihydrofolate reductase family protein [Chitinophagaceae bacterium]